MDPARLFHFDIPATGNYGDKALFPTVRDAVIGYGPGRFDVVGGASLRAEVTAELVDTINRTADGVLLGGGGLLLADTARNESTGWQWNISRDMLERLEVPLVVYAVGDNRFPGQPDFTPEMIDHVARTLDRSVFFGLRNSGSIASMSALLPEHLRDRILLQPCPTVLGSHLHPEIAARRTTEDETPVLAVQALVHRRQVDAGFDAEAIHSAMIDAAAHLSGRGWRVLSTPFHPDDEGVAAELLERVPRAEDRSLAGASVAYLDGFRTFAEVDVALGTRGHAQMIPYGMGAIPVSVGVHDELGCFASDIGFPELVVDARQGRGLLTEAIIHRVEDSWNRRHEIRTALAERRAEQLRLTRENLASIHAAVSGSAPEPPAEIRPRPEGELRAQSFGVQSAGAAAERAVRIGWSVTAERRAAATARAERDAAREALRQREAEAAELRRERDRLQTARAQESLALVGHETERQLLRDQLAELRVRLRAAERLSLSSPLRVSRTLLRGVRRRLPGGDDGQPSPGDERREH